MTERPRCFMAGGTAYYIRPATIGMIEVCMPLIRSLGQDEDLVRGSAAYEYLQIAMLRKDKACELISYRTCGGKDDVNDVAFVQQRTAFFKEHLKAEDIAEILAYIFEEIRCDTSEIEKELRITAEQEWKHKAIRSRDDNSNSMVFGGVSMYGALIGHFCKEYGWTFDYVVWGISYMNLKLLAADEVTNVYLTDEELRRCHVPRDRSMVIDLSSKEAAKKYLRVFD